MAVQGINFDDLSLIEVPVSIEGKKYTLREASGGAAIQYRNAMLASTKLGPGGTVTSVSGMANIEPLLVSLCLFDEKGKRVSEATIKNWPSRVLKTLFDRAKEISELDEDGGDLESLNKQKDEIEEKIAQIESDSVGNEQESTTNGSS
jgi:hypothetical protein